MRSRVWLRARLWLNMSQDEPHRTKASMSRLRARGRETARRIVLAIFGALILTAVAACGDSGVGHARHLSAKFSEVTVYTIGKQQSKTIISGAFDWEARRGWANTKSDLGVGRLVQLGDDCYERGAGKVLKQFRATGMDGLCSSVTLQSPRGQLELLRRKAKKVLKVGTSNVRGVPTLHYRGQLRLDKNIYATIDLWVDKDGLVRRKRTQSIGAVSTREYFDFGTRVRVEKPSG
jgi:hypothetical protein